MLHNIKNLLGRQLGALDDHVGHIIDCYFDEQSWTVRYLVVEADWWCPPCHMLVLPHAVRSIPPQGHLLPVNLTRQQIEDCPTLELNERVTRQHEIDYYRYYNWPFYWQGGSLWGPTDFPGAQPPASPQCRPLDVKKNTIPAGQLRSLKALFGFPVQTGEEFIGSVKDFLMDDHAWQIRHLFMSANHQGWEHRKLLIATRKVLSIDWPGERIRLTPPAADMERVLVRHQLATV